MRVALRRGPFLLLWTLLAVFASGQAPKQVAPGVWFLRGDAGMEYSTTAVMEMKDYLLIVDADYPGRAKVLMELMPSLSPKPMRYVLDTHAHGDHSYGNSTWTKAGGTTMAFAGVAKEMDRWEPSRWQTFGKKRDDVRDQISAGKQGADTTVTLPQQDANWVPKDMTLDIEATAAGIPGKAPAGGLPHVWK